MATGRAVRWSGHGVTTDIRGGRRVWIKRFATSADREPEREWTALHLLLSATVRAPAPLEAELRGPCPTVVMGHVRGEGLRPDAIPVAAVADAWSAAASVPPPRWPASDHPQGGLARIRRHWPEVAAAHPGAASAAVARWILSVEADHLASVDHPVFVHGDPNLENHLWDGSSIGLVDFENSGVGDLAVFVADAAEHLSATGAPASTWTDLTAALDLDPARVLAGRRLSAAFWLGVLALRPDARARNAPGRLEAQAERVLSVLDGA